MVFAKRRPITFLDLNQMEKCSTLIQLSLHTIELNFSVKANKVKLLSVSLSAFVTVFCGVQFIFQRTFVFEWLSKEKFPAK